MCMGMLMDAHGSWHVVKIPDPDPDPDPDPGSSFFTLKDAVALFRSCDFYDHKPRTFKLL